MSSPQLSVTDLQSNTAVQIPRNSKDSGSAITTARQHHDATDNYLYRSASAQLSVQETSKHLSFEDYLKQVVTKLKSYFKLRLNYYPLHFGWFTAWSLLGGVLLYAIEGDIDFIDALFMSTSALCVTGLTTNDLSTFNLASQIIIFFLAFLGGQVLMSIVPMLVRRFFFRRYVKQYLAEVSKQADLFVLDVDGKEQIITPRPENLLKGDLAVEYVALGYLIVTVLCYLGGVLILFSIALSVYVAAEPSSQEILSRNALQAVWFGPFHTISAFNNAGFGLIGDNFVQFASSGFVLIHLGILILLGNTLYPVVLRCIIVLLHRRSKQTTTPSLIWKFILDHPRRCMTHLFPSYETKWLLVLGLILTVVEFVAFEALNWHDFSADVPTKLNVALFQSISTRTAGFQCIDLAFLAPAMWVLWAVLMYVSVYPIKLVLTSSAAESNDCLWTPEKPPDNRILSSAQKFILRDAFWLFTALFVVCIIENESLMTDKENCDVFKVLFEIVSAYGTVGLSLGFRGTVTSFAAQFHAGSKFVIVLVMLFGRHRGLPDSVDRAVSFPASFKFRPVFLRAGLQTRPRGSISAPDPLEELEQSIVMRRSFALGRKKRDTFRGFSSTPAAGRPSSGHKRAHSDTEIDPPETELRRISFQPNLRESRGSAFAGDGTVASGASPQSRVGDAAGSRSAAGEGGDASASRDSLSAKSISSRSSRSSKASKSSVSSVSSRSSVSSADAGRIGTPDTEHESSDESA